MKTTIAAWSTGAALKRTPPLAGLKAMSLPTGIIFRAHPRKEHISFVYRNRPGRPLVKFNKTLKNDSVCFNRWRIGFIGILKFYRHPYLELITLAAELV